MKAVFILGALALTLVLVSADTAEESELLVREARDADARRRKGGRKAGQAKKGGKGKKKSAGRRKKGRKSGRRGMRKGGARQSTDCLTDVVAKIKVYKKAGNQLRMAKRIASWKKVMDKKKEKASSNFTDAAEAMEAATGGGASCNGAAPDADVAADLAKLKNCSVSAAALCDSAMINDTNIDSCKTNFEAFTAAFDKKLKGTPACSCFTALPALDSTCEFETANSAAKEAKKKCNSPDEPGSFGDCTTAQKFAAGKVGKCGGLTGGATTMTTTGATRSLRARLGAFKKF